MPERSVTLVRDRLAWQRTELTNERTLLSSIRTALGFFIVGIPAVWWLEQPGIQILGVVSSVDQATINHELVCMKKAFSLAIREREWCRENPVARVSMEKERNRRDRWLSTGEEERLLQAARPWLKDMILFALNTGMRMREIRELTWECVVPRLKCRQGE